MPDPVYVGVFLLPPESQAGDVPPPNMVLYRTWDLEAGFLQLSDELISSSGIRDVVPSGSLTSGCPQQHRAFKLLLPRARKHDIETEVRIGTPFTIFCLVIFAGRIPYELLPFLCRSILGRIPIFHRSVRLPEVVFRSLTFMREGVLYLTRQGSRLAYAGCGVCQAKSRATVARNGVIHSRLPRHVHCYVYTSCRRHCELYTVPSILSKV